MRGLSDGGDSVYYCWFVTVGLLAKVQRKDSLARHLEEKEKKARRPLPAAAEHPGGIEFAFVDVHLRDNIVY